MIFTKTVEIKNRKEYNRNNDCIKIHVIFWIGGERDRTGNKVCNGEHNC